MRSINYQGTVNTVEAAKTAGVRRFLNMSQLGASSRLPIPLSGLQGKSARICCRLRIWIGQHFALP